MAPATTIAPAAAATGPALVQNPLYERVATAAPPHAPVDPISLPRTGNEAQLLVDEQAVLPQLLEVIRGARSSIDFAMFSWAPSGAGKVIGDELAKKAREGVAVHVQIDGIGSAQFPFTPHTRYFRELERAGVRVSRNHRFTLDEGLQAVDHRKLLVVDGRTMFTGGMNLSHKFGRWHDVMLRVDGPAAAAGAVQFLRRWKELGAPVSDAQRAALAVASRTPARLGGAARVRLFANHPEGDLGATRHALESMAAARRRLWIETPFLTDPQMVDAMRAAAERGVDVRVAVSGKDSWIGAKLLGYLGRSFYPDLLASGVKVYEQSGMAHAKVILADDAATVGSMNMSRRATRWDHELNAEVRGGRAVRQVERLFEVDLRKARQVDPAEVGAGDRALANVRRLLRLRY